MSSNIVNWKSFSRPYATASLITLAALLSACGGGGGGGSSTPPPPPAATYTIGGSVSGLSGSGLTLQDNGGNNLQVAAGATTFVFSTAVATGGAYAVTVATQPTNPGQTCTVTGGSGTVAASNVSNISIACVTGAVTVGGTVSGLTASGLVLQDNGGDNLTVAANATTFTFATPVTVGAPYAVTILTQPSGQMCAVTGGSGTTPASAVTNVTVTCATQTAQVTGTITGLAATGLVLQDNAGDNLTVAANATTFTFATPVGVGLPYSVSVLTQPSNPPEVCTVTGGSGTVPAGGTTGITIACVPATFTVGGSVSGLSGTLVLQDNAGDNLTVMPNATSFVFATPLQFGATYAVSVLTQPTSPAQVCTVGNGSGTVGAANVTNVTIACANVGRYVYVVNSIENGNNGNVAAFSINSSTGHLTSIGSNVAADQTPTVIAIDPSGPFVYVGNKTSSDVSFFEVGNDGSLSLHQNFTSTQIGVASIAVAPTNQFLYVGGFQGATGGNAWGFNINAVSGDLSNVPGDPFSATLDPLTAMVVDPSSSFVFANSGDPHALYAFTIGSTGNLTEVANSPFTAGVRGGGIAVSPLGTSSGGFVYTADNTNSRVSAYSYDATGALTQITGSPYLSGASPQGIAVDPTGKYLYVTNFADDTVSSFSINAATGALTPIQAGATAVDTGGAGPVDVKVDPSNQFVYVVNQTDGSISTFTTSAGVLTLKGNADTGTSTKAVALAIL